MRFNIKGNKTTHSEADLCANCRHCMRIQGQKLNQAITHCNLLEANLAYPISDCSSFESKTAMTKYEMTQIAWKIGLDRKTDKIGFYSPKDYNKHRMNKDSKIDFTPPKPDDDDMFS